MNFELITILVNKAFRGTREHGVQFVWYDQEDINDPEKSLLYEELAKDHNLNKAPFQISHSHWPTNQPIR